MICYDIFLIASITLLQVLDILEKKKDLDFVLLDTPGQIEVFTWSASGTIISDAIARSYPTVIAFIMDTVRFAVFHMQV